MCQTCLASTKSSTNFYKLHLPAPLPFCRRRRRCVAAVVEQDTVRGCAAIKNEQSPVVVVVVAAAVSTCQVDDVAPAAEVVLRRTNTPEIPSPGAMINMPRRPRATLIDLVRMQQWETLLNVPIKRREAKYRDADGLYPLHWASAGSPPLAAVKGIVGVYPSAIRKADQEGSLPLHFAACYSASVEVVSFLAEQYPAALTLRDKYGRTPLYHATNKALRLSVLKLLSQGHPDLLTTPCSAHFKKKDPLSARQVAMCTPLHLVWTKVLSDRQARLSYQGKTWDKAVWMLQTAHQHHHSGTNADSLLIAAIRMDICLPEPVVPLIVAARPELLRVPNPVVPLSEAAGKRSYSLARWESLMGVLLQANSTAARALPTAFHQAIRVGRPYASLVRVTPDVVQWRDSVTGLPPALLAASVSTEIAASTNNGDDEAADCSCWSSQTSDPFKLLLPKQRELIDLQASSTLPSNQSNKSALSEEWRQVTCIYELLRANPQQILAMST